VPSFAKTLKITALTVALAAPAIAQDSYNAGAYLAGRQAASQADFAVASQYFTLALTADPTNPALMESAAAALIGLGDVDRARPIADAMNTAGITSQIANMVTLAGAAKDGNWQAIFDGLEQGRQVGPLIDGLAQAWAYVGLGQMTDALAAFDEVVDAPGLRGFGLYHKALALASVGDYEGADEIFARPPQTGVQRSVGVVRAHVEILSQLDRTDDAIAMLNAITDDGADPIFLDLQTRLNAAEKLPFTAITGPEDGISEVFFTLAGALAGESVDDYMLLYSRIAEYLNPAHIESILMSGQTLLVLERYTLATQTFARVPQDDPAFYNAELGRAEAMRRDDRLQAAIEAMQQLARAYPDRPQVQNILGDMLRQDDQFTEANDAYTRSIALYPADVPALWFPYFSRAITYHTLDDWPAAEADFRKALDYNPGQPQVLNYLGYSLIERGEKLDEAVSMIETAVAARPDSGAIVDSMGWALYKLGRFAEAVPHLEQASVLLPVDPVINDHLGDVYWAVGRRTEARFQWQRALSFDPLEVDAERIRAKLDVGLDQVLMDEGADPITAITDQP